MRFLAIDLGDKRTGIAVGSDETGIVSPLRVIQQPRGPRLIEALARSIDEQNPAAIVIGLPLNMDGSEGDSAKSAREFGDQLAARCSLPVHYHDERLTSHAAEQRLNRSGRTRRQKKQIRDALAAAEILRDFLDAR